MQGAPGKDGDVGGPGPSGPAVSHIHTFIHTLIHCIAFITVYF